MNIHTDIDYSKLSQDDLNAELLAATKKGDIAAVELLLQNGANIEAVDSWNQTPLIHAVCLGHTKVFEFLLKNKANPNAKDIHSRTALMYAANKNNIEIIDLLLKIKSNLNAIDEFGRTALDYANIDKHTDVAYRLLHAMDINRRVNFSIKNNSNSELFSAYQKNRLENKAKLYKIISDSCLGAFQETLFDQVLPELKRVVLNYEIACHIDSFSEWYKSSVMSDTDAMLKVEPLIFSNNKKVGNASQETQFDQALPESKTDIKYKNTLPN